MRLTGLLFILLLVAACGQNGSRTDAPQRQTDSGWGEWDSQGTGKCQMSDGTQVGCETLRGADGLGVDLLDTMVDVPIEVNNAEIIFGASKVSFKDGRRIDCKTEVRSGEVYSYSLNGSNLHIRTEDGVSINMKRLNETGSGLIGAWAWRGYAADGSHTIKQLTIVNENRAILQTHCEL